MFSGENPIRPSISSLAVNPLFRSANTRPDKNGAESIRFALTSFRANDSNILYIHIYIYIDWWRIFRRGIIWLQKGGTKRERRREKNIRIPSSESLVKGSLFFPPEKFIRRNATVAILVLQISREEEMRGLNLCEKTINKYRRVAPLTPASDGLFSFFLFYGRKERYFFFFNRNSPRRISFYSREIICETRIIHIRR